MLSNKQSSVFFTTTNIWKFCPKGRVFLCGSFDLFWLIKLFKTKSTLFKKFAIFPFFLHRKAFLIEPALVYHPIDLKIRKLHYINLILLLGPSSPSFFSQSGSINARSVRALSNLPWLMCPHAFDRIISAQVYLSCSSSYLNCSKNCYFSSGLYLSWISWTLS